jgi:hypothetical protein
MKKKVILISIIVGIFALIMVTPILANSTSRWVELFYKDIKISLNNSLIKPTDANGNEVEPFIIEGTTYLPVRAISNALGLNVEWDSNTNTVKLNNPQELENGTVVYDDKYIAIEFVKCAYESIYTINEYKVIYNITNKTNYNLTFQPEAISFNGISYEFSGSESVAPNSVGQVKFAKYDNTPLPLTGISTTTGTIRVIDFTYQYIEDSYDAKWTNVTTE